jgi:hydrogenase-4 component B
MTPGPLLLVAAIGLLVGAVAGPRQPRLWLASTVTAAALGLVAAVFALTGADAWEWRSVFAIGGEPLHLRLDALSALFLALLSTIGGLGAVYAHEYWSDRHYPQSAPRGRAWWSMLVLSMGLVLVVSNGLHFLIVWEFFAICAYFLITLDRQRPEVRAAGWLYLVASHTGTLALFAFFALLASRTGGWDLGPMREATNLAPLFWLALIGFGLKAGLFPLHIWLPSAHANAPSHVSAIMSGVAIKMGLYGIVRFSGWLPVPAAAGWVVIGLGAVSALLGIAFAFAQNDFKRLLAYCSVENMGVILIGLGAALLAASHGDAPWGRIALAGALLHVWNHGAFKSLLFFGAGSVLHATGTREMSRLGGLWRTMPWTAGLFALGAVAVSGLPPLNGFVSEWLVYIGLFDAVTGGDLVAWAAGPAIIMLAMTGAIALASFAKASSIIFLGAPRTKAAAKAHECGWFMRVPMIVLAGLCAVIGLAPLLLWPVVARAVGVWHPVWTTPETPVPLSILAMVHVGLALLMVAAGTLLWRKVRGMGIRRAVTWDCGYAQPTAHMQYTGGSFAGIASGWFAWALQPERKNRRPRGPLPESAFRIERVPETILERVLAPVGRVTMLAAFQMRRLQHGRLQAYILYVVVGLAAIGALVLLGGQP